MIEIIFYISFIMVFSFIITITFIKSGKSFIKKRDAYNELYLYILVRINKFPPNLMNYNLLRAQIIRLGNLPYGKKKDTIKLIKKFSNKFGRFDNNKQILT